jgi:natural product precursor
MKKLNKLVLGELAKKELSQREQNNIRGGNVCGCGCCYAQMGDTNYSGGANCGHDMVSACETGELRLC